MIDSGSEVPDLADPWLSYATEGNNRGEGSKENPSASREWKQVKWKRGEQSG